MGEIRADAKLIFDKLSNHAKALIGKLETGREYRFNELGMGQRELSDAIDELNSLEKEDGKAVPYLYVNGIREMPIESVRWTIRGLAFKQQVK